MWTDWQIQRFLFTTILRYLPDYSVVSASWPAVTSWSLIVVDDEVTEPDPKHKTAPAFTPGFNEDDITGEHLKAFRCLLVFPLVEIWANFTVYLQSSC